MNGYRLSFLVLILCGISYSEQAFESGYLSCKFNDQKKLIYCRMDVDIKTDSQQSLTHKLSERRCDIKQSDKAHLEALVNKIYNKMKKNIP